MGPTVSTKTFDFFKTSDATPTKTTPCKKSQVLHQRWVLAFELSSHHQDRLYCTHAEVIVILHFPSRVVLSNRSLFPLPSLLFQVWNNPGEQVHPETQETKQPVFPHQTNNQFESCMTFSACLDSCSLLKLYLSTRMASDWWELCLFFAALKFGGVFFFHETTF